MKTATSLGNLDAATHNTAPFHQAWKVTQAPNWDRAACGDHDDPGLWSTTRPVSERSREAIKADRRIRAAKVVCAGCPIRQPCGQWAVANKLSGIWGGLELRLTARPPGRPPSTPKEGLHDHCA